LSCLRCLFKDAPARREDFTKVKGVHNFALGFLGNVSVAERAPSISPNLKMYVDAIKAKTKLSEPTKKNHLKSLNAYFKVSSLQQD
jgi:hypothetical protein